MTEAELAWFAGLFEGEGSFAFDKHHNNIRLQIKMTDEDIISRLHTLLGGCKGGPYYDKRPNRKPIWQWHLNKQQEVKQMTIRLLPYLGNRRYGRALEVLQQINGVTKNATP